MKRFIFLVIVFSFLCIDFLDACYDDAIVCKSYLDIQCIVNSNFANEEWSGEKTERFLRPFFVVDPVEFHNIGPETALFVNLPARNLKSFIEIKSILERMQISPKHIVALNVSNNKIKEISDLDLNDFSNLQMLNLNGNEITTITAGAFCKCKISTLLFCFNPINLNVIFFIRYFFEKILSFSLLVV